MKSVQCHIERDVCSDGITNWNNVTPPQGDEFKVEEEIRSQISQCRRYSGGFYCRNLSSSELLI